MMQTRLKNNLLKKLKRSQGETITETLVSLLIITLAMTMLAGSIVSAARVNAKIRDADTAFKTVAADGSSLLSTSSGTVTLTHADNTTDSISVTVYQTTDNNSYVYYEE